MKLLVVVVSLIISSSVFASSGWSKPWVICNTLNLRGDMEYSLFLEKEDSLDSEIPFNIWASEKDFGRSDFVKSEGSFKVDILKKWFLEEKQSSGWGMAGHRMTKERQYALKIHVSSDRFIGRRVQGCFPQPLKELNLFLLCSESISEEIPFESLDLKRP